MNFAVLFWYIPFIRLVLSADRRLFLLTKDAPSFAIHGKRLISLKNITIKVDDKMDFLVDFTQNGCKKTSDDSPFCVDPIPFSINGKVLQRDGNDSVVPYLNHLNDPGSFYFSSFQVIGQSQLIVLPANTVKNKDFAVSFRVRKWTNGFRGFKLLTNITPETKKLFLAPGIPKDLGDVDGYFKILVTNNSIVTVVPDPETYGERLGPLTVQKAIGLTSVTTYCPFIESVTCRPNTRYFTFAGSDPGFAKNPDYQLMVEEASVPVQVRTTASTMFTENDCNFCFLYNTMTRGDFPGNYLDSHSLWTPAFYPWLHDRAEQVKLSEDFDDFQFEGQFNETSLGNRQMTLDVRLVEGGTLTIYAYYFPEDCSDHIVYGEDFTDTPPYPYADFQALQAEFDWSPVISEDGPFGYIVDLWEGPLPHREFELTEEAPSMAVHGYRIQQFRSIIIFVNSGRVDFLIDYAQDGCLTDKKEMCEDALNFEVDDEVLDPQQGEPVLYTSSPKYTKEGILYPFSMNVTMKSKIVLRSVGKSNNDLVWAISVRVRQWVNETKKVLPIPGKRKIDGIENDFQALIKSNVIVTIVQHPLEYAPNMLTLGETWGPTMRHGSIDLNRASEECPYFQSSITCPSSTLYSTYAGGDPGLNKSEFLLLETESGHSVLTRNTATTIFTESDCSFCLVYDLRTAEEQLEGFSLWTSYFTPWTFDQSDELLHRIWSKKWWNYFQNRSDEPREMKAEVKRIIGGTLYFWAFREPSCKTNSQKPTINVSLTNLPKNATYYFDAACFGLDWQAADDAIAGAGFVLHLWEGEIIVPINDTPITMPNFPTTNNCLFFIVGGAVGGVLILLVIVLSFGMVYQCCPGCWPMRYVLKDRMQLYALHELRKDWKNDYKSHLKDDGWEVDPFSLEISIKRLGQGAFAVVHSGTLKDLPDLATDRLQNKSKLASKDGRLLVAVKMCHVNATKEAKYGSADMLREIDFMIELTDQPHLLIFLGCSRNPERPVLITELCEKGDLLSLLRKSTDPDCEDHLKGVDLLPIAWQISDALLFLATKKLIHRDVASRNVLLTAENVAKLADFGLCRRSYSCLYNSKGGMLPIKWMAPEAIKNFEFSEKTDVWSFGVFLFELYSFGESPCVSVENTEMYDWLKKGNRLELPHNTPKDITKLAHRCWAFEAKERPNFQEIVTNLYEMLPGDQSTHGYYLSTLSEENVEHKSQL